jgi:hypothetical protein
MNKPYFSYAVLGLLLGFVPAGAVIFFFFGLPDVTWGHSGGSMLHMATLVIIGLPGMAIGCLAGANLQHGTRSTIHLTLFMGGLLGSIFGLMGGFFLGWEIGADREATLMACLGVNLGGGVGIVVGGWLGRNKTKSARLITMPLLGLLGALGGLWAGAMYLGDAISPLLGGDAWLVGGIVGMAAGAFAGVLLGRLLGGLGR